MTGGGPARAHFSEAATWLVRGSWTGQGFHSVEVTHVRSLLSLAQNLIQLAIGSYSFGLLLDFSVRFFFLSV